MNDAPWKSARRDQVTPTLVISDVRPGPQRGNVAR